MGKHTGEFGGRVHVDLSAVERYLHDLIPEAEAALDDKLAAASAEWQQRVPIGTPPEDKHPGLLASTVEPRTVRGPDQWEGVISMGDARTASLGWYHRTVWIKQMGAANPINVDRLVEAVADAWARRAARG